MLKLLQPREVALELANIARRTGIKELPMPAVDIASHVGYSNGAPVASTSEHVEPMHYPRENRNRNNIQSLQGRFNYTYVRLSLNFFA